MMWERMYNRQQYCDPNGDCENPCQLQVEFFDIHKEFI